MFEETDWKRVLVKEKEGKKKMAEVKANEAKEENPDDILEMLNEI